MRSERDPQRGGIGQPVRESVLVLGRYVRAQILIAVILTVLYAAAFGGAHVPWWPIIAIIGGGASLVPMVGSLIPIGLASLAIVLDDSGFSVEHLAWAFGGWVVISALDGFVITPKLLSRPLGIKAWLVFTTLLAGSFFFGPFGLLLAAPTLAVGAVFWRYFRAKGRNLQ